MSNGKSRVDSEVQGAARPTLSSGAEVPAPAPDGVPVGVPVRVAVARHETTDGDHLDLFVGPAAAIDGDPDARVARTWRLPLEAWDAEHLACGRFAAVAIDPHRAAYLALATARTLADGRGRVVPLLRGGGWADALPEAADAPPLGLSILGRRIEIRDGFAAISEVSAGSGVGPMPAAAPNPEAAP